MVPACAVVIIITSLLGHWFKMKYATLPVGIADVVSNGIDIACLA